MRDLAGVPVGGVPELAEQPAPSTSPSPGRERQVSASGCCSKRPASAVSSWAMARLGSLVTADRSPPRPWWWRRRPGPLRQGAASWGGAGRVDLSRSAVQVALTAGPLGSQWLRHALVEAAWAGVHTKNSYYAAQYARIARRRGPNKAAVAVASSILPTIWHLLSNGTLFEGPGGLLRAPPWPRRRGEAARTTGRSARARRESLTEKAA